MKIINKLSWICDKNLNKIKKKVLITIVPIPRNIGFFQKYQTYIMRRTPGAELTRNPLISSINGKFMLNTSTAIKIINDPISNRNILAPNKILVLITLWQPLLSTMLVFY